MPVRALAGVHAYVRACAERAQQAVLELAGPSLAEVEGALAAAAAEEEEEEEAEAWPPFWLHEPVDTALANMLDISTWSALR